MKHATTTYTMRGVNQQFWRSVKILAAEREITVRALILGLLEKEVMKGFANALSRSVSHTGASPAQKR